MKIRSIKYLSPIDHIKAENDNIDVHVELSDGRVFSILVATPNNMYWCMDNEGIDYYFGTPAVYVRSLTPDNVRLALEALVADSDGYWLEMYGALQED